MNKVLLFSLRSETIKVTVEAFFDQAGNLVIEGYDIGEKVKEYWGDSDYEYSMTVPLSELPKLYTALGLPPSQEELLTYLQKQFHENDCFSKISKLLSWYDIRHEGSSWI